MNWKDRLDSDTFVIKERYAADNNVVKDLLIKKYQEKSLYTGLAESVETLLAERATLCAKLQVAVDALGKCYTSQFHTILTEGIYSGGAHQWLDPKREPWSIAKEALAKIKEMGE